MLSSSLCWGSTLNCNIRLSSRCLFIDLPLHVTNRPAFVETFAKPRYRKLFRLFVVTAFIFFIHPFSFHFLLFGLFFFLSFSSVLVGSLLSLY